MFSSFVLTRAAVLLSAILLMAVMWGIGRIPDAYLLMVVFPALTSPLLVNVRPFSCRLGKATLWACYSAAAQFLFSISRELPLLLIITAVIFAYFTFLTLPDRNAGCIILLIGYLGIAAPPGFPAAVGRSIDILAGIPIIMLVTAPGNFRHRKKEKDPPPPAPFPPYQALTLSAELGIGTAISEILQLQQGSWVMLTILFINMSRKSASSAVKLSWQRIFAVPAGIITGGFILGTFFRIDYRFIWLLPFIGAAGFFVFYNSGNFFLFSVIFMITLTFFADWQTGTFHRFNFWENFFARTAATWIGAVIELIADYSCKYEKGDTLQ